MVELKVQMPETAGKIERSGSIEITQKTMDNLKALLPIKGATIVLADTRNPGGPARNAIAIKNATIIDVVPFISITIEGSPKAHKVPFIGTKHTIAEIIYRDENGDKAVPYSNGAFTDEKKAAKLKAFYGGVNFSTSGEYVQFKASVFCFGDAAAYNVLDKDKLSRLKREGTEIKRFTF
jgi:hypothetical protein